MQVTVGGSELRDLCYSPISRELKNLNFSDQFMLPISTEIFDSDV